MSGASGRLTISTFKPLGSVRSITWSDSFISCPAAVTLSQPTARSTVARHIRRLKFMCVLLG